MPEIVFVLIRVGFLVVLWLFVLAVIRAIRLDVFGPRVPRAARPVGRPATRPATRPRSATAPARSSPRGRLPGHLVITEGALAGTHVELAEAPVTIGRAPESTLLLTDEYASNHHARLLPHNGQWLLEDLGSTNGTYLNHAKVTAPTPVGIGAKVRIGKTVLELRR